MARLKNGETCVVDIGNVSGLSVRNLIDTEVKITVDYKNDKGVWVAITGEVKLAGKATFDRLRTELGHEHVRVGVDGPDDGRDLVEVTP